MMKKRISIWLACISLAFIFGACTEEDPSGVTYFNLESNAWHLEPIDDPL